MTEESEDLLAVLRHIAERAGKEILGYYVSGEVEAWTKDDSSPVTEADEAADALITKALETLLPDYPVVSEEGVAAGRIPDVTGTPFWLVDPLDGTKEFLKRNGEFTVNIALVRDGVPTAGVVHAPAMAMTWCGAEPGTAVFAETDRPTMPISAQPTPKDGVTVVASRSHRDDTTLDAFLSGWTVRQRVTAGSSLKFCLVASGKADLYPRFGRTMEWDTAAGHAVLRAAGGNVRTVDGQPFTYGKPGFENPHFIATGKG